MTYSGSNEDSQTLLRDVSIHVAKAQGTAKGGGICWEKYLGPNGSTPDYREDGD